MDEEELFAACLAQAKLALAEKEVAIGCVFYHRDLGKVIARGRNSVNATKNACRHAELNCIDEVMLYCSRESIKAPHEVWAKIDVYVTCEPCIMCARVLRHLGVGKVVYGCSNERFGGCKSVVDVLSTERISERPLSYKHGVKEQETINLLKTFYSGENLNAPEEMRKVKRIRLAADHELASTSSEAQGAPSTASSGPTEGEEGTSQG